MSKEQTFEIREKVYGRIVDLSEIVHIARILGRTIFQVDRVTVNPEVIRTEEGYLVKVMPEHNGHEIKGEKEHANSTKKTA